LEFNETGLNPIDALSLVSAIIVRACRYWHYAQWYGGSYLG